MTFRPPAPTLSDVAKSAGVSTATVSRCLNSPERVIESTRNRVMAAVRNLGYTPNFAARVMAAKRSLTIGAIVPTLENAIFARGLQAFQEELLAQGYTLLVASSSYRADTEEEQIRTLVSRGADGLLLIGHDRDPAILKFLQTQNVPALVAWTYDDNASLPSVGFNNRKSMRALVENVITLGHRRFGVISGKTETNDRARQRVEGAFDAIRASELNVNTIEVIETDYGIENGADAFAQLMSLKTPPTVVICGNDVLAVGAMKKARELSLDVPADVSITGFDDLELASVVVPALTTIHVPHREMGTKAAQALIEMVEKKVVQKSVELESSIRIRGTLAPPPIV